MANGRTPGGIRPEWRKFVAPEFVFGPGTRNLVGRYARNLGARKALVVTDPGVIQAGWVHQVLNSLTAEHIPAAIFHNVTPNPKDFEVAEGVETYLKQACDVIIAVGGGSPMDCAKGIGIVSANQRNVLTFEGVDEVPQPGPPLICVPTTAGSSADVSQFCIITDTRRKVKIAIISKTVVADVSLIDPETTLTMPAELTAATGLDALVHAMEAYVSNASSPITDMHALAALPLIVKNLARVIHQGDSLDGRQEMMMGSLLAGLAFSNASLGLDHAMSHSLGGLLDLPHGMCNALLLEAVVDFNYPSAPDRYQNIGLAMGLKLQGLGPESCRRLLLDEITNLRKLAGLQTSIGTLGVTRQDISRLARTALQDPCCVTNPRPVSQSDIEAIYERAL